jgi:hypothetical protein
MATLPRSRRSQKGSYKMWTRGSSNLEMATGMPTSWECMATHCMMVCKQCQTHASGLPLIALHPTSTQQNKMEDYTSLLAAREELMVVRAAAFG